MAQLEAQLFRDYFGGSWHGKIIKNGEFQREIVFNWPGINNVHTALGIPPGIVAPENMGILDDTLQASVAGWRGDIKRWCCMWYNEFGGYGDLQWTSQEIVNNVTVLYGSIHECKQESDDSTDHIVKCEIIDNDHFKYTIKSFRKGLLEIDAKRIEIGAELNERLDRNSKKAIVSSN